MRCIFSICFLLVLSGTLSAQIEFNRWTPVDSSLAIYSRENPDVITNQKGLLNSFRDIYKFLISDLDGDNCPFEPTCSAFFIEAVKQTNFIQGALMFADRFTRDLNLLKIENDYPVTANNRFYDPVQNYILKSSQIQIRKR